MYETHFGLLRRPFLATPDPDCYVAGQSTEDALAGLTLCIERGNGIGILAAAAGTGKTLLCRKLVIDLRDQYATVFLANSNFSDAPLAVAIDSVRIRATVHADAGAGTAVGIEDCGDEGSSVEAGRAAGC